MPRRQLSLKAAIAASGRAQCDIARAVRVGSKTLSLVVTGRTASWPSLRARLATELGVSETELFDEELAS